MACRAIPSVLILGLCSGCSTPAAPVSTDKAGSDAIASVLGPQVGVEVRVIAVRDSGGVIASALAAHETREVSAAVMDDASRSDWERSGFRVVVMPQAEALALVDTLLSTRPALTQGAMAGERMPIVAGERQQMILQSPLWSEVIRGPSLARRTIGLHDSRTQVGPGPLRLLGRCWAVPTPQTDPGIPPSASIRLQLVPQAFEGRASANAMSIEAPEGRPLMQEQGLTFWRLRSELDLMDGQAAIIVGEGPGVSWMREAAAAQDSGNAADPRPTTPKAGQVTRTPDKPVTREPTPDAAAEAADTIGPDAGAADAHGPWGGPVRSAGEDMLCMPDDGDDTKSGRGSTRIMVVILARPPEAFTLIAPPPPPPPSATLPGAQHPGTSP